MKLDFTLHLRPVGQGLFSHGRLLKWSRFRRPYHKPYRQFQWVYDCGASSRKILSEQINVYGRLNPGPIDLLMLSHFDKDHVIGIRELLRRRKPKLIVLPYLTLVERLTHVARLVPTQVEVARALLAPAETLRGVAGAETYIAFIRRGDGQIPELPIESSTGPEDDSGEQSNGWPPGWFTKGEVVQKSAPVEMPDPDHRDHRVSEFDGNNPLVFGRIWEFCFFNRPEPKIPPSMQQKLRWIYLKFMRSTLSGSRYEWLIRELRVAFKRERFDANEISLVAYSGPLRTNSERVFVDAHPDIVAASSRTRWIESAHWRWRQHPFFRRVCRRCSTLFTGDITLDDATLVQLRHRFTKQRMDRVSFFQVPHHGSRHSFRLSRPLVFRPDFSLFSSARYHKKYDHPNKQVIKELRKYGPLFANEFQGISTGGRLAR